MLLVSWFFCFSIFWWYKCREQIRKELGMGRRITEDWRGESRPETEDCKVTDDWCRGWKSVDGCRMTDVRTQNGSYIDNTGTVCILSLLSRFGSLKGFNWNSRGCNPGMSWQYRFTNLLKVEYWTWKTWVQCLPLEASGAFEDKFLYVLAQQDNITIETKVRMPALG